MLLKLTLWAERNFMPPPHRNTLVNWAKSGKIYPLPVFVGSAYYVDENAKFIGGEATAPERTDRKRLIERISNGKATH